MSEEIIQTSVEEVVVTNERKWRKMFPDPFPKWRIGALGF